MPNYCENSLYIRGTRDELQRFKEFAGGYGFQWLNNIPSIDDKPPPFVDLDLYRFIKPNDDCPMSYNDYGYDWCRTHHGTKWGCFDVRMYTDQMHSGLLDYHFTTAWCPFNRGVFSKMQELFPKLEFLLKYYEGGCDFCGRYWNTSDDEDHYITTFLPDFPNDDDPDYNKQEESWYEMESSFNTEWMSPTEFQSYQPSKQ
jgi:hypothetical protein